MLSHRYIILPKTEFGDSPYLWRGLDALSSLFHVVRDNPVNRSLVLPVPSRTENPVTPPDRLAVPIPDIRHIWCIASQCVFINGQTRSLGYESSVWRKRFACVEMKTIQVHMAGGSLVFSHIYAMPSKLKGERRQ